MNGTDGGLTTLRHRASFRAFLSGAIVPFPAFLSDLLTETREAKDEAET